jgi:chemotaxis protein methyltransferase CheR
MQEIEISDLRRLTEIIKEKYQYDFTDYAMSSFKRRIARIMEMFKFSSVEALIKRVKDDPVFVEEFVTEITVNVTEMFRDPSFWRELRDHIIPNILLNHKSISIWHAGCSSGEEVYSMCILLNEMGILNKAKIIATDLDRKIIERAKKGEYSMKNMDLNEKNFIRVSGEKGLYKYYTEKNGKAVMDPNLVFDVSSIARFWSHVQIP